MRGSLPIATHLPGQTVMSIQLWTIVGVNFSIFYARIDRMRMYDVADSLALKSSTNSGL